jgi:hypothetical protein
VVTIESFVDTEAWCRPDRGTEIVVGGSGCFVQWSRISTADLLPAVESALPLTHEVRYAPQSEVDALQNEVALLKGEVQRRRESHEADIALIGERLMSEAQDRSWCSEYDTIVESLNAELTVELPLRSREVEVTVCGNVLVPFSITVTVERTADMDDSDVENQAQEKADNDYSARSLATDFGDMYSAEVEDGSWEASID